MTYNEFIQAVRLLLVEPSTDTDLTLLFPRMIEYAELRMYRELDFLATETTATSTLAANSRNVTLPASIIIVRSANLITPIFAATPDAGIRHPLLRVGYDFLDSYWPASATAVVGMFPKYFALLSNTAAIVGPSPDAAYKMEFVGTMRPAALSPTNSTTYLTLNIPDMFLSAAMIFGCEFQQNAEGKARYEKQYMDQMAGVNIETLRQKAASVSWTPYQPTPQANQQRDRSNATA